MFLTVTTVPRMRLAWRMCISYTTEAAKGIDSAKVATAFGKMKNVCEQQYKQTDKQLYEAVILSTQLSTVKSYKSNSNI